MLSILNCLAEYFNKLNNKMSTVEYSKIIEEKTIYVVFEGKLPGIYISFEEIVDQKIDAKLTRRISWKKYTNIDEALI